MRSNLCTLALALSLFIAAPFAEGAAVRCDLRAYSGSVNDAAAAVNSCIASAHPGDVVEFDPGTYTLVTQVQVSVPGITLTTTGSGSPCLGANDPKTIPYDVEFPGCATFVAGTYLPAYGMMVILANNVTLLNLAFDGNAAVQAILANPFLLEYCAQPNINMVSVGRPPNIYPDGFRAVGSAFVRQLCQNALWFFNGSGHELTQNFFGFTGIHTIFGLFGSGLIMSGGGGYRIENNLFVGNTDGDVQIGTCTDCIFRGNRAYHTPGLRAAHLGFAFGGFDTRIGFSVFTGTEVSHNLVDCGPQNQVDGIVGCGFGIVVGQVSWNCFAPTAATEERPLLLHDNAVVGGYMIAFNSDLGINVVFERNFTNGGAYGCYAYAGTSGLRAQVVGPGNPDPRFQRPLEYNIPPLGTFSKSYVVDAPISGSASYFSYIPNVAGACAGQ